jgi:hypothetical protein
VQIADALSEELMIRFLTQAAEIRPIIADVLQKGFEDPKCFGCAFINIVTQGGCFDNEPFVIARAEGAFETVYWTVGRKNGSPTSGYGCICGRSCNRTSNRAHSDDRKPEGGSDCAATLPVSSARMSDRTIVPEEDTKLGEFDLKIGKKGKTQ